mmetsp:Transcript_89668/g.192158  ORF Transcript_89668/g.192158 Transcript_89668/m.192158 type:complete len:325 (+) Transcript_89668:3402-4376(+)
MAADHRTLLLECPGHREEQLPWLLFCLLPQPSGEAAAHDLLQLELSAFSRAHAFDLRGCPMVRQRFQAQGKVRHQIPWNCQGAHLAHGRGRILVAGVDVELFQRCQREVLENQRRGSALALHRPHRSYAACSRRRRLLQHRRHRQPDLGHEEVGHLPGHFLRHGLLYLLLVHLQQGHLMGAFLATFSTQASLQCSHVVHVCLRNCLLQQAAPSGYPLAGPSRDGGRGECRKVSLAPNGLIRLNPSAGLGLIHDDVRELAGRLCCYCQVGLLASFPGQDLLAAFLCHLRHATLRQEIVFRDLYLQHAGRRRGHACTRRPQTEGIT